MATHDPEELGGLPTLSSSMGDELKVDGAVLDVRHARRSAEGERGREDDQDGGGAGEHAGSMPWGL